MKWREYHKNIWENPELKRELDVELLKAELACLKSWIKYPETPNQQGNYYGLVIQAPKGSK